MILREQMKRLLTLDGRYGFVGFIIDNVDLDQPTTHGISLDIVLSVLADSNTT